MGTDGTFTGSSGICWTQKRGYVPSVPSSVTQSWNRYAYLLNNPLSSVDPDGLECVWYDGSWDSAGDPDTGKFDNCVSAGGTWVDHSYFSEMGLPDWSGDPNTDVAIYADNIATAYRNAGSADSSSGAANNWQLAAAGGQTLRSMRSFVVSQLKQITPTVCGGGGFLFLGLQGNKGGKQGFAGGLLEYDTRAGWSLSGLFEGSGKSGGGGIITKGPEVLGFVPLAEGAIYGVPVEGGALATTSGAVGAYGEAGHGAVGGGVGGYLNITTIAKCQ